MARTVGGDGGIFGLRVKVQGKVSNDVLHLSRFDISILDARQCLRMELSAIGALVVGELHEHPRADGLPRLGSSASSCKLTDCGGFRDGASAVADAPRCLRNSLSSCRSRRISVTSASICDESRSNAFWSSPDIGEVSAASDA